MAASGTPMIATHLNLGTLLLRGGSLNPAARSLMDAARLSEVRSKGMPWRPVRGKMAARVASALWKRVARPPGARPDRRPCYRGSYYSLALRGHVLRRRVSDLHRSA